MCGRYVNARPMDDLVSTFAAVPPEGVDQREPDWNVAPTKEVPAVLTRRSRGSEDDAAPVRTLRLLRWGLVPSWAKDSRIAQRLVNARVETLADKPAFRRAFASRRCLLPADGYYEWYAEPPAGPGRPRKQPYYLTDPDGAPLALAGLYEFWRDRDCSDDDPAAWLISCVVVTTAATDEAGRIHDRAPLLVEPEHWQDWLDPDRPGEDVVDLLVPAAPGRLVAWPVATTVNSVANNGPQLVAPLPPEDVVAAADGPAPVQGRLL